jgi:hypothetical protein
MQRLDTLYNPLNRETVNHQSTTFINDEGDEEEVTVNFVYEQAIYADTDEEAPKNIKEVLYGPEKAQWVPSMASEIMNSIKRKCWKRVKKEVIMRAQRKNMKSAWAFKKKLEQDKSIQFNSRVKLARKYMSKSREKTIQSHLAP